MVRFYAERNPLEGWILEAIASKFAQVKHFELNTFFCSAENGGMLVGLGGKVLDVAQCITTLIVRGTQTTTE